MGKPLLVLEEVEFRWPGDPAPVLTLQSFEIAAGERVFLHGPSGSGKSTLLSLIAGLVRPDRGRLRFADQDLGALSGAALDRYRADHLGVIFQQFNLLPWLDVIGNVSLPCRFSRTRARRAGSTAAAAAGLLEAMDLAPSLWRRRADRLSVGQQQRVAAARALIGAPELVLADEPTSALDRDRRGRFLDLMFAQAQRSASAILFVSHDESLAARFDRALEWTRINEAGWQACD